MNSADSIVVFGKNRKSMGLRQMADGDAQVFIYNHSKDKGKRLVLKKPELEKFIEGAKDILEEMP